MLGFVLWTVVAGASPAWAHAQLLGSTPANGSRLDSAPQEIRLSFTERVHPVSGGFSLLDASSKTLFHGTPTATPAGPAELVWRLGGDLPDGVYTVVWRVVSADSHPIHGAFVFGVGVAAPPPLAAGAQDDVDGVVAGAFWALRWLGYAGLAVFAGGVLVLLRCWPGGWASPRARRTLLAGWSVSVACAAGVFLLQGPYATGATLGGAFSPTLLASTLDGWFGRLALARLALLGIAGWLAFRTARARPLLAAVVAVALPVTWAGAGHAGVGNVEALAIDSLHLVAMSAWLGGLVLLWTSLFSRPVEEAAGVLARFSPMAAVCVGVLVVTGVYQAWRGVGSFAALSGSDYGRVLLYKVAAIALLLWFGALSNAAARRAYAGQAAAKATGRDGRAQRDRRLSAQAGLRRSVRIETAVAALVLGLTAVLVSTPPGSRPDEPPIAIVSKDIPLAGGGQVRLVVEPARVGASLITVSVRDSGGREWDVPEVTTSLDMPGQQIGPLRVALQRQQPGRYVSRSLTLPLAGSWRVRVAVRTSEIDMQTVETQLSVV